MAARYRFMQWIKQFFVELEVQDLRNDPSWIGVEQNVLDEDDECSYFICSEANYSLALVVSY